MINRKQSCDQKGFTLVELVVVIVILGIVATAVIARYFDLRTDAFRAAFSSTVGVFTSAVNLSQQLCFVRGWAGRDNLPGLGAGNVDFNANCWPSDTNNSNVTAANNARCQRIFQGVMTTSYTVTTTAATTFDFRATVVGGNCRFTFNRDSSALRRFDYNPGTGVVLNIINP